MHLLTDIAHVYWRLLPSGLVRVPHQVRKSERPTVSKTRARAPTATVSSGRFSVVIWAMNWMGEKLGQDIVDDDIVSTLR